MVRAGNWGLRVLALAGVAVGVVIAVLTADTPRQSVGQLLGTAALLALFLALGCAVVTAGVELRNDGTVRIVGLVVTVSLSASAIQGFSAENGFAVSMKDGTRFGSAAFGGSLLGALTNYPRSRRLVAAAEPWLTVQSRRPTPRPDVERTVRYYRGAGILIVYALANGAMFGLHALLT